MILHLRAFLTRRIGVFVDQTVFKCENKCNARVVQRQNVPPQAGKSVVIIFFRGRSSAVE